MELKKIKYPFHKDIEGTNTWYRFGQLEDAVHISDEEVEKWINQCVESVKKQLENGEKNPYSFTASGDTIVICFYNQLGDRTFDEDSYFTVCVARNYEEGDFFIGEMEKKEDEMTPIEALEEIMYYMDNNITDEASINFKNYELSIRKKD